MKTTHIRSHSRHQNINDPTTKRDHITTRKPKYTIIIDYGIPYSVTAQTEKQLQKKLINLQKYAEQHEGDYPYFDVNIYDEKDQDITKKYYPDDPR